MDLKKFREQPILGIVRGIGQEQVEPLIEAVVESGLETLEITMNTPDAPALIRKAKKAAQKRLALGAGTVLNMQDLQAALDAGATFIVMPVLIKEVVAYCVKNAIPVFPGALTPQEIYAAWKEGATMVKVFPAKFFGPEYLREIKAPLEKIELLACSGVTPQNLREYFSCGASAVSFGASVFKQEWLQQGQFTKVTSAIKAFLEQLP